MRAKIDTAMEGVHLLPCHLFEDDRGSFFEAFRASWFSDEHRWVQWNVSRSKAGVVRGLHYHRRQSDYWHLVEGSILVALVDLRPKAPSYRQAVCLEMNGGDRFGLIIPPGVLHGYRVLSDATVMYLMDQEYDNSDEFGVRWNDPALGLPENWYGAPQPILSPRDAAAPLLAVVHDSLASGGHTGARLLSNREH
jgi:dTDP-4-dehydrorhamnose 3,5-epimerase